MKPAWMNPTQIRYLTIHCAATPEGRDVKAATISKWDQDRFGQTSYHWVIELDGTAVRTLQDDQRGAHTGGANTGNIGICYVGGMDRQNKAPRDTRTPAQKATLARLVAEYRAKVPGLVVRGHRDWPGVKKACPSFDVQAEFATPRRAPLGLFGAPSEGPTMPDIYDGQNLDGDPPAAAPIVVDPSVKVALLAQTIRQLGILFSGALTLLGFLRGRDLAAVIEWAQSDGVLPFLTAVATVGFMGWGYLRTILNRRKLVTAARAAPDRVAIVKGE